MMLSTLPYALIIVYFHWRMSIKSFVHLKTNCAYLFLSIYFAVLEYGYKSRDLYMLDREALFFFNFNNLTSGF